MFIFLFVVVRGVSEFIFRAKLSRRQELLQSNLAEFGNSKTDESRRDKISFNQKLQVFCYKSVKIYNVPWLCWDKTGSFILLTSILYWLQHCIDFLMLKSEYQNVLHVVRQSPWKYYISWCYHFRSRSFFCKMGVYK